MSLKRSFLFVELVTLDSTDQTLILNIKKKYVGHKNIYEKKNYDKNH